MAKTDGGPIFPVERGADLKPVLRSGLTIRDWFAGQALTAIRVDPQNGPLVRDFIAKAAYAIADAMLAERDK